jgi:hypothetical protein
MITATAPMLFIAYAGRLLTAGSVGWASPRPSRIKAYPDHSGDQKRTAKYGTDKIKVVTGTVWQSSHAGKQGEPFGDVGKDHDC